KWRTWKSRGKRPKAPRSAKPQKRECRQNQPNKRRQLSQSRQRRPHRPSPRPSRGRNSPKATARNLAVGHAPTIAEVAHPGRILFFDCRIWRQPFQPDSKLGTKPSLAVGLVRGGNASLAEHATAVPEAGATDYL